jgi:hypothetical protein
MPTYLSTHLGMFFSYHSFMLFKIKLLSSFVPFPLFNVNHVFIYFPVLPDYYIFLTLHDTFEKIRQSFLLTFFSASWG